jgi:ketosteroid isomerase-like protein
MATLEQRVQQLEERQALQDVITAYLIAVDDRADVDAVLNCFSKDPVFDMTGIDFPRLEGRKALREFFTDTFNGMTHHAHYATNFSLDRLEGDEAACRTHVIGLGVTREGGDIRIYLQYHLNFVREAGEWKISNFRGTALMPLS